MSSNSKATVEIDLPSDHVVPLVVKALEKVGAKVWNKKAPKIEGRKLSSWKSFGEDITVVIESITEERSRLLIRSQSLVPTTLVDWGVNDNNVKKIMQEILAGAEQEQMTEASVPSAKKCPVCGHALQHDMEFCPYDGTSLKRLCPQCGAGNALEFAYCAKCGAKL